VVEPTARFRNFERVALRLLNLRPSPANIERILSLLKDSQGSNLTRLPLGSLVGIAKVRLADYPDATKKVSDELWLLPGAFLDLNIDEKRPRGKKKHSGRSANRNLKEVPILSASTSAVSRELREYSDVFDQSTSGS